MLAKAVEEGRAKHREQMKKEMKDKDNSRVDYPTHVLRENKKNAERMKEGILHPDLERWQSTE